MVCREGTSEAELTQFSPAAAIVAKKTDEPWLGLESLEIGYRVSGPTIHRRDVGLKAPAVLVSERPRKYR